MTFFFNNEKNDLKCNGNCRQSELKTISPVRLCIFLTGCILTLNACIEPYYPEINEFQDLLVVDAMISNAREPYRIKLSRSYPFDKELVSPETNALVFVTNEANNVYSFYESVPGTYLSDSSVFTGEVGGVYTLHIKTKDGLEVISDKEYLLDSPPVDSLYFEYQRISTHETGELLKGVQIFLDTHDPSNKTRFYRWEWNETWQFRTPYVNERMLNRVLCWKNEGSQNIVIGQSEDLSLDKIEKFPVVFVSEASDRLSIRYSLQIRQYALSAASYRYWKQLDDLNENQGSLFDKIPGGITGNLKCINNPERVVLGNFQASSVSTKRIFIDREDLPDDFYPVSSFTSCRVLTVGDMVSAQQYLEKGWSILNDRIENGVRIILLCNSNFCYDCTTGGTNKRPPFWTDKK